jgi:thiamine-phosphate pyrophosphorylase
MKMISKLHFITANAATAEKACLGGIDWIQLRLKNMPYNDCLAIATEVQAVCRQYKATFIINDNVALALELQADGVHLGKDDMPPADARIILGNEAIIGSTANTFEDIVRLSAKSINYTGLGPYRYTTTKEKLSPILGLEGYNRIFDQLKSANVVFPPVVGIGGVVENDIPNLMSTGLHGIAVSGAIANAVDIADAAKSFKSTIYKQYKSLTI